MILSLGPDSPPLLQAPVGYQWLVSRGYRHILSAQVLSAFPARALNLHISLLPEHRGADPNFWSHAFATRSGVSIHAIDATLDTGALYAQREVALQSDDTLRTSYDRLQRALDELWAETWPLIESGKLLPVPQEGRSSYHRSAHKQRLAHLLPLGWDTKVADVRRHASELRLSRAFFGSGSLPPR